MSLHFKICVSENLSTSRSRTRKTIGEEADKVDAYGFKKGFSLVKVVPKAEYDAHAHGQITRDGKIKDVQEVRILVTDASGNITATRTINANLTIKGTLTADKVIGAVYA